MRRILFVFLASFATTALAAPGDIDTRFGTDGFATVPSNGIAKANFVTTDANGRVLATGVDNGFEFIARLLANGQPDITFNGTGVLRSPPVDPNFPGYGHTGVALLPAEGGSWLAVRAEEFPCFAPVACSSGYQPLLRGRRLAADGLPMAMPLVHLGSGRPRESQVFATPSGGMITTNVFTYFLGPSVVRTRVTRALADGSLDSVFNQTMDRDLGCPQLPQEGGRHSRGRILQQADGGFLLAQSITLNANASALNLLPTHDPYRVCITRFRADGSVDTAYADNGNLLLDTSLFTTSDNTLVALLARPGGGAALVLGKQIATPSIGVFVVVRLTQSGALDPTQNPGPSAITGPSSEHVATVTAALMQPDGKIVMAGYANLPDGLRNSDGTTTDFSRPRVQRLQPQGGFDVTFGPGAGYVTLSSGGRLLQPNHLHLAADGSIFVAGSTGNGIFTVAKLKSDSADPAPAPQPAASAGGGGGCGMTRDTRVDPMFPAMLLMALAALAARRRRR